ncbi:hypothetical protein BDY19DRAFT_996234 [Irpex rosettiformis]|uniref:Uncharacterized protein n=1 Tax=Irpex rosettiformis TaxID=378272 RepID=A0ACB8TVF9_9APHY|nr:hypothetical protein BDY19DRAFT_996234 [Irpex rosettiformis]
MDKPLPDVPQPFPSMNRTLHPTATWANLTIDGRNHLRRFILYCLEEAQDLILAHEREAWAANIGGAMDELGERMLMGGWLPGLRRARRRRVAEKETQRATETTEGSQEDVNATIRQDDSYRGKAKKAECFTLGQPHTASKDANMRRNALSSLRTLAKKPVNPVPKPMPKHVLLTVSALEPRPGNMSDRQCVFLASTFSVPSDEGLSGPGYGEVLYGLDSWELLSSAEQSSLQLVGGTFSLFGIQEAQYPALVKVLRLSVFMYLSIILEQSLLADSNVPLRFPKPSLRPNQGPGEAGAAISRALSGGHVGGKSNAKRDSGLWAYFSRKKDDILQRAAPSLIRRGSVELPLSHEPSRSRSPVAGSRHDTGSTSQSPQRPRRFSFISDYRPLFLQASPDEGDPDTKEHTVDHPISLALAAVEKARSYLSTSPDVSFGPPGILVRLASREKSDQHHRLGGDDKAALNSLLGWECKHLRQGSAGKGMVDTSGFVRQQSFSVLYTEHVSQSPSRPSTPPSSVDPSRLVLCGQRRRWVTFRFYSPADECLGEAIVKLCSRADEPCDDPNCHSKRGDHELRFVHAGLRVTLLITGEPTLVPSNNEQLPETWVSCRICKKESLKTRMHDGTYLLSFAKFLELLIYSPSLCSMNPSLCEHTSLPPRPWQTADTPLPRSRLNIVRHFSYAGRVVSISLSQEEDVYEIRVPRLQIVRSKFEKPEEPDANAGTNFNHSNSVAVENDRRVLRREIMQFWQSLSEQMDKLEDNFILDHAENSYHKSLPRLPSADDAYDSFNEDGLATPKGNPSGLPPLPPNTPSTPNTQTAGRHAFPFPQKSDTSDATQHSSESSSHSTLSSDSTSSLERSSLQLLTSMRHTFQRTEQNLYTELSRVPSANLNDIRRSFESAGRGATKRLSAWEAKHASSPATTSEATAPSEPEWWKQGCHAVPGGNVIVRENDWGSIIAFTLSSTDYHNELSNMAINRSSSTASVPPTTPEVARPSFFSKTSSSRWFLSASPAPDPDQEDVIWHEPETYSAVISRKEHPKDTASILKLGITEVLRQKTLPDSSGSSTPSKLNNNSALGIKGIVPSAWAKPDVQISKQAADGLLSASSKEAVDKILQELEAASEPPSRSVRSSWSDHSPMSSSALIETSIRRGKASSIMTTDSDATTVGDRHPNGNHPEPPAPPPKDTPKSAGTPALSVSSSRVPTEPPTPSADDQPSLTSTFTTTLSSALRYVMKAGAAPSFPPKHHHGLLLAGSPAIDERPHIKYDWTIGKRLKFSCTVYYAKQFDALRRRCGIEDTFLQSLARSENWVAEGGKSRSNFWKTSDNQFIIKTLVNAWNVADLHVLIELGPSYFRHMDATANKPTVLAKLLGFFTVEIRNLETGNTQAKADLLVMENLFYNQNIVKTFDLKGIQGRKVKASSSGSGAKTLFDGDWIEGQQRALTLVQPHSKVVLHEAIKADSDFLARSNIMDYSLLLGINEEQKQIACGLVDTIGSYTFAKTLEYKAKQNLTSGKEVTVIPPNEYQERFINAMDNYFVACPDKWSKPLDDTKIPGDYLSLPSVL